MENVMVSAIITTHNRLSLLKRAIESVQKQTYRAIECIVVNDASTDETDEYCSSLEDIIYVAISPSESRGGNYARNIGIKRAQGRYVAFCDDDDYWIPTKIEKQLALANEKGAGYVYCDRCLEYVDGNAVKYVEPSVLSNYCGDVSKEILTTIFSTTSEILIERDLLLKVGMFDENLKFWQEYELSIRLAQITPFQCVKEPLVVYRIDEQDSQRLTNKYEGWRNTVKYIYRKHKNLYAKLSYKQKLCYYQFIAQEAIYRSERAGLRCTNIYYRILLWVLCMPQRIKHFVFYGSRQ